MMTLEDILHEDKIAVPVWAAFTVAAAVKPFIANEMHTTVQTFISILPALCGAYLGYRHIQSIQAFKLEKMRAEHALERERIAALKEAGFDGTKTPVELFKAVKSAKPSDDTVDLR